MSAKLTQRASQQAMQPILQESRSSSNTRPMNWRLLGHPKIRQKWTKGFLNVKMDKKETDYSNGLYCILYVLWTYWHCSRTVQNRHLWYCMAQYCTLDCIQVQESDKMVPWPKEKLGDLEILRPVSWLSCSNGITIGYVSLHVLCSKTPRLINGWLAFQATRGSIEQVRWKEAQGCSKRRSCSQKSGKRSFGWHG